MFTFQPLDHMGNLIPDPEADYQLFDRVVNVRDGFTVPLGMKGIVIGVQQSKWHRFQLCLLHNSLYFPQSYATVTSDCPCFYVTNFNIDHVTYIIVNSLERS